MFVAVIGLLAVAFAVFKLLNAAAASKKPNSPKFPGPKGIPILGSLPELPINGAVFVFKQWNDKYGPICEATVLGQRMIFLASEKYVKKMLVQRSSYFSGRPKTATVNDSQSKFGTGEYLPLMSYNEDHHRQKKVAKALLAYMQSSNNNFNYSVIEARRMLHYLDIESTKPGYSWSYRMENMASRVISRIAYGSPDIAETLYHSSWTFVAPVSPNGTWMNLLPFLTKIPFFLNPFKINEWFRHKKQQELFLAQQNFVRDQMKTERGAPPSLMREYFNVAQENTKKADYDIKANYEDDRDACRAIGMLATAATFTTGGPFLNIVRGFVCFPEWQTKLQAEMDSVVGPDRMPQIEDIPKLPLMRAYIREIVRWRSGIPTGIPHETEEDNWFEGVFVQKGTMVFAIDYALSRDPEVYTDPYGFDPMRWLDPKSPLCRGPPEQYPNLSGAPLFGFGRRYCPGNELAQEEINMFAAHLIWAFNFEYTEKGRQTIAKDLVPHERFGGPQWPRNNREGLIILRPEDYELVLTPRSEKRRQMIHTEYEESKKHDLLREYGNIKVE